MKQVSERVVKCGTSAKTVGEDAEDEDWGWCGWFGELGEGGDGAGEKEVGDYAGSVCVSVGQSRYEGMDLQPKTTGAPDVQAAST